MKKKFLAHYRAKVQLALSPAVSDEEYENVHFREHRYTPEGMRSITFRKCLFSRCDFSEGELKKVRFEQCVFADCNLNVAKLTDSQFDNTMFIRCRLSGIDWSACNTSMGFTVQCYESDLSYNIFSSMDISESKFIKCQFVEALFSEVKARKCKFRRSDFTRSQFQKSVLIGADFRKAKNYLINPHENICKNAKFSYPEILGLLYPFGISEEDIE
ncbi:MAG: pentapeptide repeat-containing protein [Candidatus Dojkabacteria bacterium]|nr:MAG: pentapeptide repeat-containing protein [Candidatus Dojkabacteria bacterium]